MADHNSGHGRNRLRSRRWFDEPLDPALTALYIERYLNFGLTREELQGGKPIIGIAQTGSDISPCNRHHIDLAHRLRDGIRDAGGIPLEFPIHPIQETGKRPTAALDRNLAYLSLVEVLHGYPLDGVVLTIGCDKTDPYSSVWLPKTTSKTASPVSRWLISAWRCRRATLPAHRCCCSRMVLARPAAPGTAPRSRWPWPAAVA